MIKRQGLAVLLAGLLLAGCASTSPKEPMKDVSQLVRERVDAKLPHLAVPGEDDADIERAIGRLLQEKLEADDAVRIALLGSPKVRAKLEELSISQADLVQAGLLKNPTFAFGKTAWEAEHIQPNLFASIEQDFLDIATMPLRKRVALTELEGTKLALADELLETAARVRTAYFSALAAEQLVKVRRITDEAARASSDLAKAQHQAGNVSDLALTSQLALSAETTLELHRAEGEAAIAREELNKELGLWGERTSWKLPDALPPLPNDEVPLDHLEARAVAERLDLAAARRSVQAMDQALGLAKATRWFGTVNVAVEAGRLRHTGKLSFGPSIALEIPLFDQRQAQIAKLEAFRRQGALTLQALAVDVRADVRAAQAKLLTTRRLVESYARIVMPLREGVVRYSQEQYDAMLLGVYALIDAKQSSFESYRAYTEALRDYWIARSDLERAIGSRLTPRGTPKSHSTSPAPASRRTS